MFKISFASKKKLNLILAIFVSLPLSHCTPDFFDFDDTNDENTEPIPTTPDQNSHDEANNPSKLNNPTMGTRDYVPRVNFCARLEPEKQIIHGAGQDLYSFEQYQKSFNNQHKPLIYMTYIGLNRPIEDIRHWGLMLEEEIIKMGQLKVVPQIGLFLAEGKGKGGEITSSVIEGKFDPQIKALFSAIASLRRPVFLRIAFEFEGPWNGYNPASYVKAWIYITHALRQRGLEFATVWSVAGGASNWPPQEKIMEYYPGNEWVDWWAVNIFSEDEFNKPGLNIFLDAARSHQKPVMIGEMTPSRVGVLEGEKSWERWFSPMINLLMLHPEIKAISYINWKWNHWGDKLGFVDWLDWGDARIEKNETVRKRWVEALSDPIFLHAQHGSIPLSMHPCNKDLARR